MTEQDADRLRAQVAAMTWAQHLALWKWVTLALWEKMGKGMVMRDE